MEIVMTNGFAELSANEIFELDGGGWKWYDYVGVAVSPVYGTYKIFSSLYELGFSNGYYSTK